MAHPINRPPKRTFDQQAADDYNSGYLHPTNSNYIANQPTFHYSSFSNSSAVLHSSLYAIPEATAIDFTTFPNPIFPVHPAAYSDGHLTAFRSDLNADALSLPNGLYDLGPETSQFLYFDDNFQFQTTQAPPQSLGMSRFPIQPSQWNNTKSHTSREGLSVQGRSVGSVYVIDSPYGHADAATPGTSQTCEIIERPPEVDYNPISLSGLENDLFGINNGET